jgi:transposase-like protein
MIKHAMDCCREPIHKQILGIYISRHRNIIIAESFLSSLIELRGKHIVIVIREEYGILGHVSY